MDCCDETSSVINLFRPKTVTYLCGGHFIASAYKYVDSIKLKLNDNAVPSIFKLPEHFMKIVKTRKSPVKRKFVEVSNSVTLSEECSNTLVVIVILRLFL